MFDNQIHYTVTNRIPESEGGGWEFWCVECSYRVRYTRSHPQLGERLEILDIGDPRARHTSNQAEEATPDEYSSQPEAAETEDEWLLAFNIYPPDDSTLEAEIFDEQAWLTPEIRERLGQIIARLEP